MNMKRLVFFAQAALAFALLGAWAAQAAPAAGQRWVSADHVRVRGIAGGVVGTAWRGDEVFLREAVEADGSYLVEMKAAGDGRKQYGFIASRYLSATRIAGEDGASPPRRWVRAVSAKVREKPGPEAAVAGRLALNAIVKLLHEDASRNDCEIQLLSGQKGFVFCEDLEFEPADDFEVDYGKTGDEIERAFWLKPGWRALEAYAQTLQTLHPEGPWPRNDALERMKAHLALGLMGRKPEPYADWASMKRKLRRWQAGARSMENDLRKQGCSIDGPAFSLNLFCTSHLGEIQGFMNDADGELGRAIPFLKSETVVHLVSALELARVQPSLFRSEAEIAPPAATAEQASGRFGIVFRQTISPRSDSTDAGLYDMAARAQSLTRPVKRVQLFRNGRLAVESSFLRKREPLWGDSNAPECEDYVPGFSFGDADPRMWSDFEGDGQYYGDRKANKNPAGSLFAFYTTIDLPRATALRTETLVRLDRKTTGFARGAYLYYDLNGDGIADLVVWEGQGKGPESIVNPGVTDDRWYRLALVNINGAWKVLGSDAFSYGCGC